MSEEQKRLHRCCFTGHRPRKLPVDEVTLCSALDREIDLAIRDGYTTFISGMAMGVDIMGAELVIRRKEHIHSLHIIAACPYPGSGARWSSDWQDRYHSVLKQADIVRYISNSYWEGCFQKRNEWLVNHSNLVIAVYCGCPGGTRNTIEYAKRMTVELRIISPQELCRNQTVL